MTRTYYKAILQKLHRQKFYLHRSILNKHQREFLNVSNDVPNWFSKCRNYKNCKGIVIQRLWVFEFRDQVPYFRDVSELRVPPNLSLSDLIKHGTEHCTANESQINMTISSTDRHVSELEWTVSLPNFPRLCTFFFFFFFIWSSKFKQFLNIYFYERYSDSKIRFCFKKLNFILFYFILFYFILFYFILFYFILLLLLLLFC